MHIVHRNEEEKKICMQNENIWLSRICDTATWLTFCCCCFSVVCLSSLAYKMHTIQLYLCIYEKKNDGSSVTNGKREKCWENRIYSLARKHCKIRFEERIIYRLMGKYANSHAYRLSIFSSSDVWHWRVFCCCWCCCCYKLPARSGAHVFFSAYRHCFYYGSFWMFLCSNNRRTNRNVRG